MEQLFVPQTPPDDEKEFKPYLKRTFQDLAQNLETIADGRIIQKRHVAPPKPRDGMIVYADGTDWNPGSGEGIYGRVASGWVPLNQLTGAVLASLFNANTILKADTDDTPTALTVPVQTLVGRITAGVITALNPAQVITLLAVLPLSGGQMTGNITMAGAQTVDGRDLSADGTKLDGIEADAEVNDLVLLATASASASATVEFTSIPSTYSTLIVEFTEVVPATDDTELYIELDYGAGFLSSNYKYSVQSTDQGGTGSNDNSSSSTIAQIVGDVTATQGLGNAANETCNGSITFFSANNSGNFTTWLGWASYENNGKRESRFRGSQDTNGAISGIRFHMSSGNITAGEFKLSGVV